jgi:Flp pilus assembly pilin Flp
MIGKRMFFEKGNGIVEYILVTALVAIGSIAMFRLFREDLSKAYKKAGEAIVQGVDTNTSSPATGNE